MGYFDVLSFRIGDELMDEKQLRMLVDRFLSWPLPKSVCSDPCVTLYESVHDRHGTNLLTADEARQMLQHVLAESKVENK